MKFVIFLFEEEYIFLKGGLQMKKFITFVLALGFSFCVINVILLVSFFSILSNM